MKFVKFLIGLPLLPVCVIASQTLWGVLESAQPPSASLLPAPALALFAGFALWIAMFTLFPNPVRTYIFAHELTHALWGLLMGASITKFNVREDHGSVVLSKTNFLITLAPYFFPLYTVLVIAAYSLLGLFYPVERFYLLWLAAVGFTWGFHLTFTVSALLQRQSDIRQQGRLFSYAVIYLANVTGICAWVIFVSGATLRDAAELAAVHGAGTWELMTATVQRLAPLVRELRLRH